MNETIDLPTQSVAVRETQPAQFNNGALAVSRPLQVKEILDQVRLIQDVMHAVMKEGEHYGAIPGCGDKKTLLQPGAQKLTMTFRLAPDYNIQEVNLDRGHKEYRVTCTLRSIQSGTFVGQGVGCCSTMESKYRWRQGEGTPTGKPVPKAYWVDRNPELLGGKGFIPRKIDNQWVICEKGEKVENDNPADTYNTVLKMAKKRAFVDATITATAASDIFTQDVGDEETRLEDDKMPQDAPAPQTAITPHPEPTNTPQAKETHPKAVYANDSTRAWMIQRLEACRREATEYFQKCDQLLDTEGLEDLPLRFVPIDGKQMLALTKAIWRFAVGDPAEVAFEPNQEKVATAGKVEVPQQPELSPEWFWDIMCPIPHKGEKRDAYLKNPDTIRSLYDAMKGGAKEAQDRLFGFANRWKPEARTVGDKTYQPSAADLKFREALDAFIRWEIEHSKPLVAEEV